MKTLLMTLALASSLSAHAESLIDCQLFTDDGVLVEEVAPFNIDNYSSNEPEANIDGSLLDFDKNDKTTTMSFSNECDNMYGITFSNQAIKKALSGEYKILIGEASIGTSDFEEPFVGTLKCIIRN